MMSKIKTSRRSALLGLASSELLCRELVGRASILNPTSPKQRIKATGPNIIRATLRPSMRGIFSSRIDQRAAIVDFVREAARDKKTIEWGPIDITIDAAARIRGRQGITVPSGTSWTGTPDGDSYRFSPLPMEYVQRDSVAMLDELPIIPPTLPSPAEAGTAPPPSEDSDDE